MSTWRQRFLDDLAKYPLDGLQIIILWGAAIYTTVAGDFGTTMILCALAYIIAKIRTIDK